jgi:hypothetical protein
MLLDQLRKESSKFNKEGSEEGGRVIWGWYIVADHFCIATFGLVYLVRLWARSRYGGKNPLASAVLAYPLRPVGGGCGL